MRMIPKTAMVLLVITAIFAGCGTKEAQPATDTTAENTYFEGTVLEVAEGSLLVEPLKGMKERASADQIWVSTQNILEEEKVEALGQIEAGDIVGIGYDGMIAETYPAQISGACEIQLIEKATQETQFKEKAEQEMQTNAELYGKLVEIEGTAVGIFAHIKEINGDEILISSDSDDFPGAFHVQVPENVYDVSELSGGSSIQILMQDKEEKDSSGIPEYLAKNIVVLDEQEDAVLASVDVLLTSAPAFTLTDPLSNTYAPYEIQSGNYSWNCMYEGEMIGVVACGVHPMDEVEVDKLKLPDYQNMSTVSYTFSTTIAPDILKICKWDAVDIGNTDAEEISVITYYYQMPLVELEPGRVYEFTASWKEDHADLRGFYGDASYTLVTE